MVSASALCALICEGTLLPDLIRSVDCFLPTPLLDSAAAYWAYDRVTWITIAIISLTPLCFIRKFENLKFVRLVILVGLYNENSYVGVSAMCYIVGMVTYCYVSGAYRAPPFEISYSNLDYSRILVVLPLLVLSFACPENVNVICWLFLRLLRFSRFTMTSRKSLPPHMPFPFFQLC